DLPAVWNAPSTDTRTKQRLIHILVQEIVCDLDEATNEAVLLIHWTGGRHTEVRVARVKTGRCPDMAPSAVEALRKLAGHWPDRELAVSLNRMRCKTGDGETWTTVRVREMRERLGIPGYDPAKADGEMISLMKAAERLGICVGSAKSLALKGRGRICFAGRKVSTGGASMRRAGPAFQPRPADPRRSESVWIPLSRAVGEYGLIRSWR
ncbi:hypothetical protein NKH83_30020, partial [Mesorhizobium sp. M0909]